MCVCACAHARVHDRDAEYCTFKESKGTIVVDVCLVLQAGCPKQTLSNAIGVQEVYLRSSWDQLL